MTVEKVLTNLNRYDSKSTGMVENASQEVEGQVRTLKQHTEERIGKTAPDHPIIHRMVEYAAEVIDRFRVINKKVTLQEAIRGNTHIEEDGRIWRECVVALGNLGKRSNAKVGARIRTGHVVGSISLAKDRRSHHRRIHRDRPRQDVQVAGDRGCLEVDKLVIRVDYSLDRSEAEQTS